MEKQRRHAVFSWIGLRIMADQLQGMKSVGLDGIWKLARSEKVSRIAGETSTGACLDVLSTWASLP